MATKKPAAKKVVRRTAASKSAVVKKPVAKKPAAAKPKRVVRRKPVALPEATINTTKAIEETPVPETRGEDTSAQQNTCGECVSDLNRLGGENLLSTLTRIESSLRAHLELMQIEVIDLRKASVEDRFFIIGTLVKEGFLASTHLEANLFDLWYDYLQADAIKLQHRNKLVTFSDWEAVKNSTAISVLADAEADVQISFTPPSEAAPDNIMAHGEIYTKATK